MIDRERQRGRAREFARAVLDLAEPAGGPPPGLADAVQSDLDDLAALARTNADLAELLGSPLISASDKKASVERIFAGRLNELTMRLLRVLGDHDALSLLGSLAEVYRDERDGRLGRVKVEAITAAPLDGSGRQAVSGRLSAMLAAPVILQERVDPSVLGGLVLRIGDTLFDGSVRHRLAQVRRQVIERGCHEIQGGRDLLAD